MITIEQAKKLPTHRLLTYYKSINRIGVSYTNCKCIDCEDVKKYAAHRTEIKAILDTREHISK